MSQENEKPEFWENAFSAKQEMWWWNPADSTKRAAELFKKHELHTILIPGFGYGRNAGIFIENWCAVTGIEISETAVEIAKKHFGASIKIHHGSVSEMPFDRELYDGIFSYALLHLLDENVRNKCIEDCYNQTQGRWIYGLCIHRKNRFSIRPRKRNYERHLWDAVWSDTLFFYDADLDRERF
jgi:hypothetical protein